jgi:16S rRNA A1518/A1519 N6-dimethyltransferase RsmA/KsgA/DIM1 with predicted DNA glycosylase/AP lyase activity
MPQEAVLQMVFHQHEPGTQVTPEEFENICRWVTAESNKRLLMSLRDLTEEQVRELARRMMTLTAQILDKDRLDSNDLADLQ